MALRPGVRLVRVHNGVATFSALNEFQAKVTLIQLPTLDISACHQHKMTDDADNINAEQSGSLSQEGCSTGGDVPSFCLHIPDAYIDKPIESDLQWCWSLTDLSFYPGSSFSLIKNLSVSFLLYVENCDGSAVFEDFQVEYMRRELDARMINTANRLLHADHLGLNIEDRLTTERSPDPVQTETKKQVDLRSRTR